MQYFRFYIAIIVSGLLLTACDQSPSNSTQRKARTHLVNTITIEPENSIIERRFNAQIIAPNTVKISNQIAGTILKMPFREGSSVQKGELLVQLDDSLTTAELKKAQANFEKASQNLNRIQKLIPKQLASAEEMSAASTDLKLAEADITLKTIQLERSKIRAPFSGVISERFYEPGDSIISNKQLLTLVDDDLLLARSAIPETFISFITKDKAVKINIPSLHLNLEGKIKTIYPTVDKTTQQISIEVSLKTGQEKLYPGQFAEVSISYKTDKALMIPVNAVQYDTKGSWVYTIDNNKALQTYVKTGQNINNKIEVLDGLKNGDTIISQGFVGLRPGKKVTTNSVTTKHSN